jgi:hypothetical protein
MGIIVDDPQSQHTEFSLVPSKEVAQVYLKEPSCHLEGGE